MTLNDLLDDGKPYPCSRVFIARVQALKYCEDALDVSHVDTYPVVAHRKHPAVFRFLYANVNYRGIIAPKLYRIT
jgi:hypothetical protein